MKNWRPKDWDNNRMDAESMMKTGGIPLTALRLYREAFEAGADAMLEALKEQGRYWGSIVERPTFVTAEKGWLVFIPDEEAKE